MIFDATDRCKKLPPHQRVEEVIVYPTKRLAYPAQAVTPRMYAGFCRESIEMPRGKWYFCVFDGHLHLYPFPEKKMRVSVRIVPLSRYV